MQENTEENFEAVQIPPGDQRSATPVIGSDRGTIFLSDLGKKVTTYFHAVNSGDLIAGMAGLKEVWEKNGTKAVVYQQLNRVGN